MNRTTHMTTHISTASTMFVRASRHARRLRLDLKMYRAELEAPLWGRALCAENRAPVSLKSTVVLPDPLCWCEGTLPMTTGVDRPNPDELLARLRSDEKLARRGKLKIFFGYAAGVGKTYAMLEAARREKANGVDVVVGYVEP